MGDMLLGMLLGMLLDMLLGMLLDMLLDMLLGMLLGCWGLLLEVSIKEALWPGRVTS